MNGSIQWLATSCQLPSQSTTSSSREAATFQRMRTRRRRATTGSSVGGATSTVGASNGTVGSVTTDTSRSAVGASAVSGGTAGSPGAGELDLDAQRVPDRAVELEEVGRQPDVLDLARALEGDRHAALDGRRAGGHHHDGV